MVFYLPKLLAIFLSSILFSVSLLSFNGLVLWGWGLRTDRVSIALSRPYIADLFNNNNNNKVNNNNDNNSTL